MKIQEESPLLLEPLANLEEDYEYAVLHLAWDRNAETKALTLLFAFVELLPAEIPPPIDDYDYKAPHCSCRLGNKSKHHVYLRHAVVKARAALDWYLACRVGTAVLPGDGGVIPAADAADAKRLRLTTLGEAPVWPTLLSASDDTDILPFCPQWITCPRTHHLLPLADFDLGALWSVDEREEAQGWLKDHLHFDLGEYPEYWGSVHLVAPNPVFRKVRTRLQRRGAPAESVLVQFESRAGKSVSGLEMVFREQEPWGVTAARRVSVDGPLLRMNFDRQVEAVLAEVWDPRRGLLEVPSEPHHFIKRIHLDMSLMRKVVVQTPGETYELPRTSAPKRTTTGAAPKVPGAGSRLLSGHLARQQRSKAREQGQQWFKDQKDKATELLRSLLNEANSSVLLIDPYFGAEELARFGPTVGRDDIPIRILTSAEVLKEKVDAPGLPEEGDQLLYVLEQVRANERMNPFEIRVMTGGRPSIHDRFLALGKSIWILGSSLNEFGSRGTMMLALPDPDAIRGDLEDAWKDAENFEPWLEKRRKKRRTERSPIRGIW